MTSQKEVAVKNFPKSGKQSRPRTTVKGKRYLCATCRKRSPKPVFAPAPWYCDRCLREKTEAETENAAS
jgi:hypothetical protein